MMIALGGTSTNWEDMCLDKSNNLWATVDNGDIYKCLLGSTTFNGIGETSRQWRGITSDYKNNIWATVYGEDIYRCISGTTTFLANGEASKNWVGICADFLGDLVATVNNGDIYKSSFIGLYIFSEVSPSSSRLITNNGDVPEPFIATLYGPAINPTLINETTGEYIHLVYTLNIGESLVINTAFGNKTIVLNAGGNSTNGLQYLDPLSTFFQLQVGDNLMNLHDDSGSSQLRCDVGKIDRYVGV
jgi:hypothetical protein